ncbi:DMT family transporter [Paraglaciecola chathamensis]|uniref:DMT family transporter n=1 Tax=Paraglaciecola chathamensis TaxID=368405 RepID=A0ABS0WBE4_9ALTE|nr:DMT family transporter [Paraglaciecola chathamensis]MBJ2135763.1 DMT family transporter [Paraglaciecola chathamensis]
MLSIRGELHLLSATLLAAVGWVASKLVIDVVPGDTFLAVRFLLASAILFPFCFRQILKISIKRIFAVCSVGVILALSLQVWVYAVSITNSLSEGAFIMSLAMIIAPFTSWMIFRQRPQRAFWLALPIAIIGLALMTLTNSWQVEPSQWCFLISSTLLSVHFVFNKRVTVNISPLLSIFCQLLTVGIVSSVFAMFSKNVQFELNQNVIMWFIVSIVVATSIRYLLQTVGQFSVNMETAALIMILEPIWTLVLSMSLLDEVLAPQKLFGAGIIFMSLFVYVKLSRRG